MKEMAVIQVRGSINMSNDLRQTLLMLNLKKKHNCVIIPATPQYLGMLQKAKDYITYGEIDSPTKELLLKASHKDKTYYLQPPKGGFEKGGIKRSFNTGGALGSRGTDINRLIKKMMHHEE